MKIVQNLSKAEARSIRSVSSNTVWISFSDPDDSNSIVHNSILENLNNFKITAWNLSQPHFFDKKLRQPPNAKEIESIVDFLVANSTSNVIVNCSGGIGRSAAVSKFCHDKMNYFWKASHQENVRPNLFIYNTMVEYFNLNYADKFSLPSK
jgi:hypothetical protein